MKKPYFSLLTSFLFLINPSLTVLTQIPKNLPSPSAIPTNPDTIRQIAQGITVKILVADTNSSGVIIAQNGTTYTVITNAHVVTRSSSIAFKPPTGRLIKQRLNIRVHLLKGMI